MQPVPCVMRTTLRLMAIEPSSVRATPAPRPSAGIQPDVVVVASGYVRALESLLGEHGVLGVAAR